ncbi:MAG: hypothetical protein ACXQTR_01780 [Candidatus Methanospirareceae archaeon]
MAKCGCHCEVCGKPVTLQTAQLAHRIPKTKGYIKRYGSEVIHHDLNIAVVCSLRCNSAVLLDPSTHPIEAQDLVQRIRHDRD